MSHAQDRRTVDDNGFLHARSRISKAVVNPYLGREIPGWQEMGLSPDRVYQMYRTPELLRAIAASFNNVPLILDHQIATPADFPADRVCGTVSNPMYEEPYLVADVTVWNEPAISLVETDAMRELSCAYRYVPSMIPGEVDGVHFHGQMLPSPDGGANHVALVEKGRAGSDVLVADSVPKEAPAMKRPKFIAALSAILAAASAVVKPEQLAALDSAMDEEITGQSVKVKHVLTDDEKIKALDEAKATFGRDLSPEETESTLAKALAKKNGDDCDPDPNAKDSGDDPDDGGNSAMDAKKLAADAAMDAAVQSAVAKAREGYITQDAANQLALDAAATARAEVTALFDARKAVADKVGEVALDSAAAVYRFALDKCQIDHKDVPNAALAALWGAASKTAVSAVALDSSAKAPVYVLPTHIRKG